MSVFEDLAARIATAVDTAQKNASREAFAVLIDEIRTAIADLAPVSAEAAAKARAILDHVVEFVEHAIAGAVSFDDLKVTLERELSALRAIGEGLEDAAKQEAVKRVHALLSRLAELVVPILKLVIVGALSA